MRGSRSPAEIISSSCFSVRACCSASTAAVTSCASRRITSEPLTGSRRRWAERCASAALLRADVHAPRDRLAAGELGVDLLRGTADPACEIVGSLVDRPERRDGGRIAHQRRPVQAMDGDLCAGVVERVEVSAQRADRLAPVSGCPSARMPRRPSSSRIPVGVMVIEVGMPFG